MCPVTFAPLAGNTCADVAGDTLGPLVTDQTVE